MKKEFFKSLGFVSLLLGKVLIIAIVMFFAFDLIYTSNTNLVKKYSEIVYGNGTVELIKYGGDEITFKYKDEDSSRLVTVDRSYAEDTIERGY